MVNLNRKKLHQTVKSFFFRKKMSETLDQLGEEIRNSLLTDGKNETVVGDFKVSIREDDLVEITKLPPLSLEQLELPLK